MVIGTDDRAIVTGPCGPLGDGPAPNDTKDIDVDYYVINFEFIGIAFEPPQEAKHGHTLGTSDQ